MSVLDGLDIHSLKRQDRVQMLVGVVVFRDVSKIVHIREIEVLGGGKVEYGLALGGGQELSLVVQKFEGVPLPRIVRGRKDDAAVGLGERHGQLRGRRGGETCPHHIHATGHESPHDKVLDHPAGQPRVLADNDLVLSAVWLRLP